MQIDYMFLSCKTSNLQKKQLQTQMAKKFLNEPPTTWKIHNNNPNTCKIVCSKQWGSPCNNFSKGPHVLSCKTFAQQRGLFRFPCKSSMQLTWLCSNATLTNFIDKIVLPTWARRQALPSYSSFLFPAPIPMQGAFPKPYTFLEIFGWMVAICALHHPMILTIELQNLTRTTIT